MAVTGTDSSKQEMRVVVKELEINGTDFVPGDSIPASQITVTTFTTAGSTEISGNLQQVLEAIADLADPGV